MRVELLLLALAVGGATWLFRVGPMLLPPARGAADTPGRRFLAALRAATGPAAIATLFTASVLPHLEPGGGGPLALVLGIGAVLLVYAWRRSVVLATLAGAAAYGLGVAF